VTAQTDSDARICELEARLAELTGLLDRPALSSRRRMLRLAAGAAAGTVAAAVGSSGHAAAANGNPIVLGAADNTSTALTATNYTTTTGGGAAYLFQSGTAFSPAAAGSPCALAGWSTQATQPNGIYGYTTQAGDGIIGIAAGASSSSGVSGRALGSTPGVSAGLRAESAGGPTIQLVPVLTAAPRSGTWKLGALVADTTGRLWYCTATGTPGTWVDLAAAAADTPVPTFHALTPFRAYDSRAAQPATGAVPKGGTRTLSVKDKRDLTTGAVVAADLVPPGATAVSANVTVVDTVQSGFLTLNPGGDTTVNAATVNWSGAGQILNNGVTLAISTARELTVIAGGADGASTHLVIDITGYFG